jgi:hypothetical protein
VSADAPAVVIEANFRPYSDYERAKLSGLAAQPVEVHCVCPPVLAVGVDGLAGGDDVDGTGHSAGHVLMPGGCAGPRY